MRERQKKKKGRTWAEAARTVQLQTCAASLACLTGIRLGYRALTCFRQGTPASSVHTGNESCFIQASTTLAPVVEPGQAFRRAAGQELQICFRQLCHRVYTEPWSGHMVWQPRPSMHAGVCSIGQRD
ncbi:hypothetical protein AGIG_G16090 [Arapaima gigas]